MKRGLLFWFVWLCAILPAIAQNDPLEGEVIDLTAADGQVLKGELFLPEEIPAEGAPAVLLMHQYGGRRDDYQPLLPLLLERGYVALAVDLRGFGETKGRQNWETAVTDVQAWLDYLRGLETTADDQIATLGASIGSNLALVGCANDEACVTAIALSPGLNYFDVQPEEFVRENLADRSALLIASTSDAESAVAIRQMFTSARGNVATRMYKGFAHGTELFRPEFPSVSNLILNWLDEQNGRGAYAE